MKLLLLPVLAILASIPGSFSLSCPPCGFEPCQDPVCCDSGFLTTDACGCCAQCASSEGGSCGGPFGIEGSCGSGTRCLRSCAACNTVSGAQCIFPFSYQGKTYTKCTTDNSDNNAPWCAVQVDNTGEVVNNKWEDCESECQYDFCDDGFLFNEVGRCVNGSYAPGLLRTLQRDNVAAKLDEEFSSDQKTITTCPSIFRSPADQSSFCRCSNGPLIRDLQGSIKGGCVPPVGGTFDAPDLEAGYCFLENIQDPANPTSNCYDDASWSEADGRFWSSAACRPDYTGGEEAGIVFES